MIWEFLKEKVFIALNKPTWLQQDINCFSRGRVLESKQSLYTQRYREDTCSWLEISDFISVQSDIIVPVHVSVHYCMVAMLLGLFINQISHFSQWRGPFQNCRFIFSTFISRIWIILIVLLLLLLLLFVSIRSFICRLVIKMNYLNQSTKEKVTVSIERIRTILSYISKELFVSRKSQGFSKYTKG